MHVPPSVGRAELRQQMIDSGVLRARNGLTPFRPTKARVLRLDEKGRKAAQKALERRSYVEPYRGNPEIASLQDRGRHG